MCKDGPGHQSGWTQRFGDSDFWDGTSLYKYCCSEVHPNFQHSVYQCSLIGLDLGFFFIFQALSAQHNNFGQSFKDKEALGLESDNKRKKKYPQKK